MRKKVAKKVLIQHMRYQHWAWKEIGFRVTIFQFQIKILFE